MVKKRKEQFVLNIDKFSKKPIYEQIIHEIEEQIVTGILGVGDKLPSVRGLSVEIAINPNTIQKAYTELERLGITESAQGQGRFVSRDAVKIIKSEKKSIFKDIMVLITEIEATGLTFDEIIEKLRELHS